VALGTRARVREAAAGIGYKPNALARALATQRTQIIGLIVGDISDSYFAEIARGVEDTAGPQGYLTILCNADRNPDAELAYFRMLLDHKVAAVMFAGGLFGNLPEMDALQQAVQRALEEGRRVLALAPRDFPNVQTLAIDNRAVTYDMTRYLIQLGHRTIAYVGGPGELEYHAQLAPFYELLNVTPPSLFPRLSATFVDQKCERLREKLGRSWDELLTINEHELTKQLLREADEHDTAKTFAEARAEIEDAIAKLKTLLRELDPTLEGALGSTVGKALHPLEQLEQKANKAIKQQHAVELARLQRVLFAVRPGGKPMERAYGTAWGLLTYGVTELLNMLDQLPADGAAHHIVITE